MGILLSQDLPSEREALDAYSTVVASVAERLAPLVPAGAITVGESGIFHRADVERLGLAGVHAVLVGESLIVEPDRAAAVRELLGSDPGEP